MPSLSHQCKEELPSGSPSLFTSCQQIEERQQELAACDAPFAADKKSRRGGRVARLPLAETREAASEGLKVGKENLEIAKAIRTAITSLAKDIETMKQCQETANTLTLQIARQRKRKTTQPPTPDTA